jgi:hypothetical protein
LTFHRLQGLLVPVSPPSFVFAAAPTRLPSGYAAAPITPDAGPLKVCVVLRTDAKAGAGPLISLRDTLDARVYLGCVTDAAGAVVRFVEVWVQDASGLSRAPATYRGALTNKVLDERWVQRADSLGETDQPPISCGWEATHPAPIFLDAKTGKPVPPRDGRTGAVWALCTDEAVLEKKGAPGYGATLVRHLYQPDLNDATELLPLDLVGQDPAAITTALGLPAGIVPLNPGGGLMMVLPLAGASYEHFCDAVSGHVSEAGDADALLRSIATAALGASNGQPVKTGGWLGLTGVGLSGRLVEALHVKLMLLAGAISRVRNSVQASQAPFLNISADTFRVGLASGLSTLPLWWTAQAVVVYPGEALELPIQNTATKYFVAPGVGGLSIYAPASMGQASGGKGWLRLRNVATEAGGAILEGTLTTQERITAGANDLIWLRVAAGTARVDLHAVVDATSAMASGEIRLRTIPTRLPDPVIAHLRSALGVPIPDVTFEMVPLLSTPCDLYALGVLAVRTLLAGGKRPLPVALDETLSLAMQAAADVESGRDLTTRIAGVFERDKRFHEALGPHRLLADAPSAEAAFEAIPPRLWFGVLGFVIRFFTGQSLRGCARGRHPPRLRRAAGRVVHASGGVPGADRAGPRAQQRGALGGAGLPDGGQALTLTAAR